METGRMSEPGALPVSSSAAKEGQSRFSKNIGLNIGESALNCQILQVEMRQESRVFSRCCRGASDADGRLCRKWRGPSDTSSARRRRRYVKHTDEGSCDGTGRHPALADAKHASGKTPHPALGDARATTLSSKRKASLRTEYRRRSCQQRGRAFPRAPSAKNGRNCRSFRHRERRRAPPRPQRAKHRGCQAM